MRVILSLFLSCFLLGLLVRAGNGQLVTGQGILPAAQGTVGNSLPGAPTLNDALTSILAPLLGGNNGGKDSLVGNLTQLLNKLQTVSVGSLLQGILNGNLSGLDEILGPVVGLLQSLPIVGPLITLLSEVLSIPLTLVASIVALLLELLLILLNITRVASG